ncbi:MAG: CHASE4 domain-containing protein [bacterium]
MTLRKKTIWTIGIILALLFIAIYQAASFMTARTTKRLEAREISVNAGRATDAVNAVTSQLQKSVSDWANWDDSYEFMKDHNQKFIRVNMTENAFSALGVNLIIFLDTDGKVVWGNGFDLESAHLMPIPSGLMEYMRSDGPIMRHPAEGISGIMMLADGPMMFAARPVLTSNGKGPARGILVMGRWLDAQELAQIAATTHLRLELYRAGEEGIPADTKKVVSRALNKNTIAAYAPIEDVDGRPALILKVTLDRDMVRLGSEAVQYLGLVFAAIGLVFIALLISVLDRMVLSRLAFLNRDVGEIGESSDITRRVALRGRDELGKLAISINSMLDSLERSQIELKRLAEIVASSGDGIFGIDLEGCITSWNRGAARIYGYSPAEIIGKKTSALISPEHLEVCGQILENARHGQGVINHETECVRKDGQFIDVSITLSPSYGESDKIIGASMIARDISEHKRAEDKLKLAGEELLRMSNVKSEFTSMVSHELRNPLSAIKEALAIVLEGMNGPINEQQQRTLGIAGKNIDRLVHLTTDLLDFTRLESGRMDMHFANTDLGMLMHDVYMSMKPMAEKSGVALSLDLPEKGLLAVCDEDRIRQVITNLVVNSLKFTKSGGSVKLVLGRDDHKMKIDVSDTGIGIKEADVPKLFQVFGQIYSKDTAGIKGSGLGLSISKQIVEAHKGTIDVHSVYGEGTTFTVEFPGDLQPS